MSQPGATNDAAVLDGARNLLADCAGMRAGETLLVLHEDPTLGYYGPGLAEAVLEAAATMGIRATARAIPFDPDIDVPPADLRHAMLAADRTLFLARMGDQLRFNAELAAVRPIVCYALNRDMLGSVFGRAPYRAFVALKASVDAVLAGATSIRVTCPLGTDFSGPGVAFPGAKGDVTVARFPMSVFTPAPAAAYRGRVAQAGFLVGTGSKYYQPYGAALRDVLFIAFEGNHITGFEGDAADVDTARRHYAFVADRFGIDRDFVHSWHAGIHPGCAFPGQAGENLERWSGAAFGNPRLLHFHTCGAYAPGEICWNVVDPTVLVDGVAVWENGRLHPERVPGGSEILAAHPQVAAAFAAPAQAVGLAPHGRLSAVRTP
ncbi:hypothetical protein EJC49_08390 [Aquibium carbonis]|uniref:Leucyl aminopeptidase (Aminopeptidase T) n=1 Tax=Aquibium carbonis TaxID=2495581 RepID=A0A429YZV0_9HYPH|nr:hypothetical protein [Aquibium carbonis]RST86924.1 hypothetical protein EJC49_08390 [Aquibium carbonis]